MFGKLLTGSLIAFVALPALALEVRCESELARVTLSGDTATIEDVNNTTVLRSLQCKLDVRAGFHEVACTGPETLNISEMEAVLPGGGGFRHLFHVSTSHSNKSYTFASCDFRS